MIIILKTEKEINTTQKPIGNNSVVKKPGVWENKNKKPGILNIFTF